MMGKKDSGAQLEEEIERRIAVERIMLDRLLLLEDRIAKLEKLMGSAFGVSA